MRFTSTSVGTQLDSLAERAPVSHGKGRWKISRTAQEHLLIRVEGVGDDIEKAFGLCLELYYFAQRGGGKETSARDRKRETSYGKLVPSISSLRQKFLRDFK